MIREDNSVADGTLPGSDDEGTQSVNSNSRAMFAFTCLANIFGWQAHLPATSLIFDFCIFFAQQDLGRFCLHVTD
jgi:hypothetical protein